MVTPTEYRNCTELQKLYSGARIGGQTAKDSSPLRSAGVCIAWPNNSKSFSLESKEANEGHPVCGSIVCVDGPHYKTDHRKHLWVLCKQSVHASLLNDSSKDLVSYVSTGCHVNTMKHGDVQRTLRYLYPFSLGIEQASSSHQNVYDTNAEYGRHKAHYEQQHAGLDESCTSLSICPLPFACWNNLQGKAKPRCAFEETPDWMSTTVTEGFTS